MRDIRTARDGYALQVDSGIDPLEAKTAAGLATQRQLEAERVTQAAAQAELVPVGDLLDAWLKDGIIHRDGNASARWRIDKHIRPAIGHIPVKALTEQDVRATLRPIAKTGRDRTAVTVHANLKSAFAWAEKRQPWRGLLIDGNPVDLVDIGAIIDPDYKEHRDRTLSDTEIRELATTLDRIRESYAAAPPGTKYTATRPIKLTTEAAIWIMLSTLCRVGELSRAEWKYVDFEARTWHIPRDHVKPVRGNAHKSLDVYLSDFALAALQRLHALTGETSHLFPSADRRSHLDEKTIAKQISDRQIRFSTSKNRKTRRQADSSLVLSGGTNGKWTPHDLRRTGATRMQDLGVPLDAIDFCQNHVLPGSATRRHYMHGRMETQMRDAWDTLGRHLESVVALHPPTCTNLA